MPRNPGQYANSHLADLAEAAALNRAELGDTMASKKQGAAHLQARAQHSHINDLAGAISDQRAYGSGTVQPRGHRPLHKHFATGGNTENPYAGPSGGYQQKVTHYDSPAPSNPKQTPAWGGDDKLPAVDHSQNSRRR